jgi:hypothetical protein
MLRALLAKKKDPSPEGRLHVIKGKSFEEIL